MSEHTLARQLFASPGADSAHTRHLLAQAAGSHARLLAAAGRREPFLSVRNAIDDYLRGYSPPAEKRFVLDDPQFVEALHLLASTCGRLAAWDAAVAPGCSQAPAELRESLALGRLGNVVAPLLLRRSRDWCGQINLATDDYGRMHIPFCDWALVLSDDRSGQSDLFAHQIVVLELDEKQACFVRPGQPPAPLVRMPRPMFNTMFVDNRDVKGSKDVEFCTRESRTRFERDSRLGKTPIRFEPLGGDRPAAHAELTGAIVAALLAAIQRNAPAIHQKLCRCIRTIQGFELPAYGCGQIASFSVPTSPGIIGFNVQYTERDEPRFSPYSFMWLGHELGHTLHYLIDDVAYTHGWRFLENPGETTPMIPRYGRTLSVRTLLQIPYTHLFEWWLLMLFHERQFAGLPWRMFDDAQAVGQDVHDEIFEAFELIDACARLTATGRAVVERMRELVAEADSHWRQLSFAATRPNKREEPRLRFNRPAWPFPHDRQQAK